MPSFFRAFQRGLDFRFTPRIPPGGESCAFMSVARGLGFGVIAEKPWAIDGVLLLFLGIITTYCLGMLPIGLLDRVTVWTKGQRDFAELLTAALFSQITALVWLRFFLRKYGVGWREAFGLKSSEPVTVAAYGVLAGALFIPVAMALQWVCENLMLLAHWKPEAQAAVQALQNPDLSLGGKIGFGVVAVVMAPLVEEPLFRGVLYPVIKQMGYPRLAWWGTSLLFAALHFNEQSFVPLLAFGLVLAWLYETYWNLLAPIVAHGFFNAANFAILMVPDQVAHRLHLT